jgi:hypothetical protein
MLQEIISNLPPPVLHHCCVPNPVLPLKSGEGVTLLVLKNVLLFILLPLLMVPLANMKMPTRPHYPIPANLANRGSPA